jgi:3-methyladenine DNA glycosylase AlkD
MCKPAGAQRPRRKNIQATRSGVDTALAWLERHSTRRDRENLTRFGITAGKAFGVSMANIQRLAKTIGRDHDLAAALWQTGWYEARLLTAFVDEPARVTSRQMDRWCRDFDNWGICDTLAFHLFDRSRFAWAKVDAWRSTTSRAATTRFFVASGWSSAPRSMSATSSRKASAGRCA